MKNTIFMEKLSRIARFCHAKGCHSPRKLLQIATKPWNSWKFSPSKSFFSCGSIISPWLWASIGVTHSYLCTLVV